MVGLSVKIGIFHISFRAILPASIYCNNSCSIIRFISHMSTCIHEKDAHIEKIIITTCTSMLVALFSDNVHVCIPPQS